MVKSTFLPGYYNGDVKSQNKSDGNKFCETMAVQRYLFKFLLKDLSNWKSFNFYWKILRILKCSFQHKIFMKLDRLMARCTKMNLNIHNLMQTLTAIEFLYLQKNPEFHFSNVPVHLHSGWGGKWGRECSRQWGREVDFAKPKNHNLLLLLLPPPLTNL